MCMLLRLGFSWEGIDPDRLDGQRVVTPLAAALGLADTLPVRRRIAGTGEARTVDKGLHQHGLERIPLLEVLAEATQGACEQVRGQVGDLDPGQQHEPVLADHQREVRLTLRRDPADEAVARCEPPGGGAEAHGCQRTIAVIGQVPQLGTGHGAKPEVMVAGNEFVPQARLRSGLNQTEA